jgi:diguanylate cyclase (GGDEF)-like protein
VVVTLSDISEQKRRQETIQYISQHDSLTGLPNRNLLSERLEWHVKQARRSKWQLCVCFLDLDGFKAINDQYGHSAGDRVLKEVARRLLNTVREVDTVARLGGDEFAMVLSEIEHRQDCLELFDRVLACVRHPVPYEGHELEVSASLGVAFFAQDIAVDGDQLLRQADKAMYDAKLAGKNRCAIFDTAQDLSLQIEQEKLNEIGLALQNGEFVLRYQPKVNLRTGAVVGAEALLRWVRKTGEVLDPDEFLPAINNNALAERLGSWVIASALGDLDRLVQERHLLHMGINVFPRQLVSQEFLPSLQRQLDRHERLAPELVELEIVESAALNDLEAARRAMTACRELGVRCSLDDSGTGFSSLTHLKYLPITALKIDKSFVRDVLTDADDLAIVEGTISLAAAFGHEVIAEGVETIDQGIRLLELGCELAQGYAIARPMPLEEFIDWMRNWKAPQEWLAFGAPSVDKPEAIVAERTA